MLQRNVALVHWLLLQLQLQNICPSALLGFYYPGLWITQVGLITVTAIKLFRTVIYEGPDTILVNTRNSHFKWPNKHL